ncbi:MAG: helix-turn-helix transcriptional regulator [Clostridia bacterium]|nr:helix-turn-helix transcriptional regulator [Clostridia bacterium]
MIIYKDIMERLKENGYSSYRLRKENLLPQSTLTKINQNLPVNLSSIDAICKMANCQPGDILEYVPDQEKSE